MIFQKTFCISGRYKKLSTSREWSVIFAILQSVTLARYYKSRSVDGVHIFSQEREPRRAFNCRYFTFNEKLHKFVRCCIVVISCSLHTPIHTHRHTNTQTHKHTHTHTHSWKQLSSIHNAIYCLSKYLVNLLEIVV